VTLSVTPILGRSLFFYDIAMLKANQDQAPRSTASLPPMSKAAQLSDLAASTEHDTVNDQLLRASIQEKKV